MAGLARHVDGGLQLRQCGWIVALLLIGLAGGDGGQHPACAVLGRIGNALGLEGTGMRSRQVVEQVERIRAFHQAFG